jgi:hypothetical protein
MTLGRLLYLAYHRPLGLVKTCVREGGPIEQWKTERGKREMEAAAWRLPSIGPKDQRTKGLKGRQELARALVGDGLRVKGPENSPLATSNSLLSSGEKPLEIHVLTGRKFWYQTAFCLWSLAQASGREVVPHIYDDGSLKAEQADYFRQTFPRAKVFESRETVDRLDEYLPSSRFPRLRERWLHYPNIRKLTDPHAGQTDWKLVIDSDLLFFHSPDMLCRWADAPDRPLHAVDSETAYGYPLEEMGELAGHPVVERLNVGLCGLKSDVIDWERLEYWCDRLIEKHGTHYYLEQALVAMLTAGQQCAVLPPEDYVTLPREPEVSRCEAVMHHYVASSKPWYFRTNWRRVLATNP